MNIKYIAALSSLALLTGCATGQSMTDAESCALIGGAIDSMMFTFDDPEATPESASEVFTKAAADLTAASEGSEGEKAQWAASISALASFLNQNIADSDGDAMVQTLDALFVGFGDQATYCAGD
jgi:hypothetical protein